MLRSALLIAAALLTAVACAPPPPAPSAAPLPPLPPFPPLPDITCPGGKLIKDNVFELAAMYDHEHNSTSSPPQAGNPSGYGPLVQSAFNRATPDLMLRLCNLDKIYIDQFNHTDYAVWGMNAGGYHLTSLLLHATGTVLLYLVISRILILDALIGPN